MIELCKAHHWLHIWGHACGQFSVLQPRYHTVLILIDVPLTTALLQHGIPFLLLLTRDLALARWREMILPQAARRAARLAARWPQCVVNWDRNLKPKLAIMRQCPSVTDRRTDRRTLTS